MSGRPIGSNYRLGGGGGGGGGGGAHINFKKKIIFFFFFFFKFLGGGGGGHICANYWGGTAPRAPLFLRPCQINRCLIVSNLVTSELESRMIFILYFNLSIQSIGI